ncbi:hypothetical protein HU200_058449 [Digitaria exilis]|uniref:RING-type domain-containing protein n=1 Tax=Digitaria exilis TaxID=1010633 RepID=A0A835ACG7_9POAL|nr:hypothetical protein HU200_058449 [Digitaria exilis]
MDGAHPRRSNGAWEIDLAPRGPATARPERCAKLFLLWLASIAIPVLVFVFAGYVSGSVATAALLVVGCLFTFYYYYHAPPAPLLPEHQLGGPLRVGVPVGEASAVGLSEAEVEAIPAFEYRRKVGAPGVQCAVCINVVRDGETVRRLPACGHAFHTPCVDGWLRAHATCPMCRADVKPKVAAADAGEPEEDVTV